MEVTDGKQICKNRIKLQDIYIDEYSALKYSLREKLLMVNENQQNVGEIKINVGIAEFCDYFEFVIHSSSKFSIGEHEVSVMSMTSRVRPSLTTLEEIRNQYTTTRGKKIERSLFLAKFPSYYHISTKHNNGVHIQETSNCIPISDIYNFISEGANIIILKNMALQQLTGKLKTRSMIINGVVCKSAMIAEQDKLILNGKTYKTTKVTRLVKVDTNSTMQKLETWLNNDGQILLHSWENSKFYMKIDHRLEINSKFYTIPLKDEWDEDLQLVSHFVDTLEKLKRNYTMYLTDYPEVKQLLGDFVFHILRKKPVDIIEFAVKFFLTLAK